MGVCSLQVHPTQYHLLASGRYTHTHTIQHYCVYCECVCVNCSVSVVSVMCAVAVTMRELCCGTCGP